MAAVDRGDDSVDERNQVITSWEDFDSALAQVEGRNIVSGKYDRLDFDDGGRAAWNAYMRKRYADNIAKGLTAHGKERKKKTFDAKAYYKAYYQLHRKPKEGWAWTAEMDDKILNSGKSYKKLSEELGKTPDAIKNRRCILNKKTNK